MSDRTQSANRREKLKNGTEPGQHLPTMPDPANDPATGQQLPTERDSSRKPVPIDDPSIGDEPTEKIA